MYPEARIDVEVSSDEDDVPKPDASAGKKKVSANNDTEDGAVSSTEPVAPNPISSGMSKQADLSTAGRVATVVAPAGGRGRKHLLPATSWSKPLPSVDQMMTQVELPLYCGPRSPLDLIAIEIVFGCIFEVF
jgi:hypothetical protein